MKRAWPVLLVGIAGLAWALRSDESVAHLARPPKPPVVEAPRSAWSRFAEATARTLTRKAPESVLAADLPPEQMFEAARELQARMTPTLARRCAEILRTAPRRAVGLHALMGRREVRADVIDFFLRDPDPEVRATAAFLLQEIPEGLPAEVLEAARANVRSAPDALRVESMELLAASGLTPEDTQLILEVGTAASGEVRIGAARALAAGKADRSKVLELMPRDH
jgi:hypothetical protein